jgi:hypothetical protein
MRRDCIGMVDMLERDLKRDLHGEGSTFANQTRVMSYACRSALARTLTWINASALRLRVDPPGRWSSLR